MKNVKYAVPFLVAGLLFAPVASHATDTDKDRGTVGEYVSDSIITTKVKAKLAGDDSVSALDIQVDTDKDGVVVLSGTANSKAEADKAHSIAHSVEGVKKVLNRIKIQKDD
ncbi:MAG: BON domain-containing protein [Nitrosospira sp.]|nr:BON domain-containing protein [Nitrosospira sp.]